VGVLARYPGGIDFVFLDCSKCLGFTQQYLSLSVIKVNDLSPARNGRGALEDKSGFFLVKRYAAITRSGKANLRPFGGPHENCSPERVLTGLKLGLHNFDHEFVE